MLPRPRLPVANPGVRDRADVQAIRVEGGLVSLAVAAGPTLVWCDPSRLPDVTHKDPRASAAGGTGSIDGPGPAANGIEGPESIANNPPCSVE